MAYFKQFLSNPSIGIHLGVLIQVLVFLGPAAWSRTQANPMLQDVGPHGGNIHRENGQNYEVNLNPQSGQLDVYTESTAFNANPPQNAAITLYKNDQSGQTVRLKAMDPPADGFIHYQGQISPLEGPYIAFGIQFNLEPSQKTEG